MWKRASVRISKDHKADYENAIAYCKKDDHYVEFGVAPSENQGRRGDVLIARDLLVEVLTDGKNPLLSEDERVLSATVKWPRMVEGLRQVVSRKRRHPLMVTIGSKHGAWELLSAKIYKILQAEPEPRNVLFLSGDNGVGKTTLMNAVCEQYRDCVLKLSGSLSASEAHFLYAVTLASIGRIQMVLIDLSRADTHTVTVSESIVTESGSYSDNWAQASTTDEMVMTRKNVESKSLSISERCKDMVEELTNWGHVTTPKYGGAYFVKEHKLTIISTNMSRKEIEMTWPQRGVVWTITEDGVEAGLGEEGPPESGQNLEEIE